MADQLWIVFVDGVAQTDVLPYAGSEEIALRLWRDQTGRGEVARERLHALENDRRATALTIVRDIAYMLRDEDASIHGADFLDDVSRKLDHAGFLADARADSRARFRPVPKKDPALAIVQNIALMLRDGDASINGADFLDDVSRELDAAGFLAEARAGALREPGLSGGSEDLTTEEQAALRAWAAEQGRTWKAALRDAWYSGNYGGSEHDAELQRIRNKLGPSWLVKYRLPVDPSAATTGYRCWVRTSVQPNETRIWVATRRLDAVAQVKTAVRNNTSEGGVESHDPGKPFEVTFAMVRGKLIETKHTD